MNKQIIARKGTCLPSKIISITHLERMKIIEKTLIEHHRNNYWKQLPPKFGCYNHWLKMWGATRCLHILKVLCPRH